jgi:hypothetical protein
MPRHTKLTEQVHKGIIDALKDGANRKRSALLNSVTERTWHMWFEAGSKLPEDLGDPIYHDPSCDGYNLNNLVYRRFFEEVPEAEAENIHYYERKLKEFTNGIPFKTVKTVERIGVKVVESYDSEGRKVVTRTPVAIACTETTEGYEVDTKIPMDVLKRLDRETYGERIDSDVTSGGKPIESVTLETLRSLIADRRSKTATA